MKRRVVRRKGMRGRKGVGKKGEMSGARRGNGNNKIKGREEGRNEGAEKEEK